MKKCYKCGSTNNVTTHHWLPVCHFGRHGNNCKVSLCEKHHHQADMYIEVVESYKSGKPLGFRKKLPICEYRAMALNLKLI